MPQPFQDLDMQKFQNMSFEQMKSHLVNKPGIPPAEITLNSKVAELSHFIVQNFREQISSEEHIIDTAKKVITSLQSSNEEKEKEIERLKEVLTQCDDYFDNYADADYINEKYAPNPEMQLLAQIRRVI